MPVPVDWLLQESVAYCGRARQAARYEGYERMGSEGDHKYQVPDESALYVVFALRPSHLQNVSRETLGEKRCLSIKWLL